MKKTLKELRNQHRLTQPEIAKVICGNVPLISAYESGQNPPLEDMVLLEKRFNERILWEENISANDKLNIIDGLVELMKNYPLNQVLTFAQRSLKEGARTGNISERICIYVNMQSILDESPLLPTEFNHTKNQQQC